MSKALDALLKVKTDVTDTVKMERFDTEFTYKALTEDELADIRDEVTKTDKDGKKQMDERKYNSSLIAKAVIDPAFNTPELLKAHNVPTAAECVRKVLLAGEVVTLVNAIMKTSGFDIKVKDIKN